MVESVNTLAPQTHVRIRGVAASNDGLYFLIYLRIICLVVERGGGGVIIPGEICEIPDLISTHNVLIVICGYSLMWSSSLRERRLIRFVSAGEGHSEHI